MTSTYTSSNKRACTKQTCACINKDFFSCRTGRNYGNEKCYCNMGTENTDNI